MDPAPVCIGIILDGNRRFAKERGLSSLEGHRRGFKNIEPMVLAARDFGVAHVVVYAFSTENWIRAPEEVSYLLELFEDALQLQVRRLAEEGVAVRFVGQRERFSIALQASMRQAEEKSPAEARTTLWICLSYGGRAELVHAAREAVKAGLEITEASLAGHLWTRGMPDPDLIIRPGGEKRLSNFLLWQSAYSELFFIDTYWPEFSKEELLTILEEYARRERRMGK